MAGGAPVRMRAGYALGVGWGGLAPLRVRVRFRPATGPGNAEDPNALDAALAAPLTSCYACRPVA